MENIVAVKVLDKTRGKVAFLTWGRVFDSTDPKPLMEAVAIAAAARFGLHQIVSIEVCKCLQEAADHQYFFEALSTLSGKPIPLGRATYRSWSAKMRRGIKSGKELYLLGGIYVRRPARR